MHLANALQPLIFRENKYTPQKELCRIVHSTVSPAGLGRSRS